MNSPLKISRTERCIPHPIHSTPNNFLFRQGSIKSSIDNIRKYYGAKILKG
ncbi:hypothetical protein [Confluentibacter citreus]|uniref:hypothetical protein n=1 Tax=Confluentibacter citreus TaxID=2007307 RepID=UPI001EFE991B|nr:hypothetical protein [Confluentibacter citreus]